MAFHLADVAGAQEEIAASANPVFRNFDARGIASAAPQDDCPEGSGGFTVVGYFFGKKRLLGIPTVRDRVVQTAVVLLLLPIFETDFHKNSFAYRPMQWQPQERMRRWLWKKHAKTEARYGKAYSNKILHDHYGLVNFPMKTKWQTS